jgi:hypothetical protein
LTPQNYLLTPLPTPSKFEQARFTPRQLFNFRWPLHRDINFNRSLMKKKTINASTCLFSPIWDLPMIPSLVPAWHLSFKVSTHQVPSCFHDNICFTFCHSTPTLFYALQLTLILQKWTAKPAYLFNNFSSIPVSVYRQNNTSTNCTHSSLKTHSQTGKLKVDPGAPTRLQAPSIRLFTRQKDIYPIVSGVLIAP